jgi:hemin uptake protein HemP
MEPSRTLLSDDAAAPHRPIAPPRLTRPAPVHPAALASQASRSATDEALRSEDLLRGRRAVEIVHGEARYRLSVTALGKLILTK